MPEICQKCGNQAWYDGSLHWYWCENPGCLNNWGAPGESKRLKEIDEEIDSDIKSSKED